MHDEAFSRCLDRSVGWLKLGSKCNENKTGAFWQFSIIFILNSTERNLAHIRPPFRCASFSPDEVQLFFFTSKPPFVVEFKSFVV